MFTINDDLSIYATRGDTVFFTVMAEENGTPYFFEAGDVLRMKVFQKKNANNVVLEKLFPVTSRTDRFVILLTEEDTKIGDVISKATDYWYEIELNPFTNPQTIIGYDEDGAKVFRLFPEGKDSEVPEVDPEDIPVVDDELDMTSSRPVRNRAIARAIVNLDAAIKSTNNEASAKNDTLKARLNDVAESVAVEKARVDLIISGDPSADAELVDIRVGLNGVIYGSAGTAVREQNKQLTEQLKRLDVRDLNSAVRSTNLLNLNDPDLLVAKYMGVDGRIQNSSNGSLCVSGYIPVKPGMTYSMGGDEAEVVRFVTAFDVGKQVMVSAGSDTCSKWSASEGVAYIRVTFYITDATTRINEGDTLLPFKPYGGYLPVSVLDMDAIKDALSNDVTPYIKAVGDLTDGGSLELEDNSIKTYKQLAFSATIDSFDKLHIGHGYTGYGANYLVIDDVNIYIYDYSASKPIYTYAHGLTIENNIQVKMANELANLLTVRVQSNGHSFEKSNIPWMGCNGVIFAKSEGSTLTGCVLSWTCKKYTANIYAFGDSYFGTTNPERWVYYLLKDGYTDILLDGYAGRNSEAAYKSAYNALKHGTPKVLLWCMGMNDADSESAVNASWKTHYDNVKALCELKKVELVLSTTPSTASVNNKYKNEIVRNSGFRYIDFAKAVGSADTVGEWYPNMLSADGVHPTEYGAKTLYLQALADLPELMGC